MSEPHTTMTLPNGDIYEAFPDGGCRVRSAAQVNEAGEVLVAESANTPRPLRLVEAGEDSQEAKAATPIHRIIQAWPWLEQRQRQEVADLAMALLPRGLRAQLEWQAEEASDV